jgi:hypothetical protein
VAIASLIVALDEDAFDEAISRGGVPDAAIEARHQVSVAASGEDI